MEIDDWDWATVSLSLNEVKLSYIDKFDSKATLHYQEILWAITHPGINNTEQHRVTSNNGYLN